MSPTAAAARSSQAAPSLQDRLKDASLLREQCYIDGAWTGTPANPVTNPANGCSTAVCPFVRCEATPAGWLYDCDPHRAFLARNDHPRRRSLPVH